MYVIILLVVVASAIYGPHIWAKHVLTQYSDIRENLPGTGIELAEHLVDRLNIARVRVEGTELPDHYDPLEKVYKHHSCTLHITSSQGRKALPFLFWVIVTKNWPASWLSKNPIF